MIQAQVIQDGLSNSGGDFLLQKKVEVMLDLQYKKIKGDMDTLKTAIESLAQEIEGLKNSMKKSSYSAEQYTSQNMQQPSAQPQIQPQFQQMQQPQMQQPTLSPQQMQQFQAQMQGQMQQPQQSFQQAPSFQMQPQQAAPQQAPPQQAMGTGSAAQQQYQKGLTSDDVSIEKFFSFGGKKR
jgi:hypothetical protein